MEKKQRVPWTGTGIDVDMGMRMEMDMGMEMCINGAGNWDGDRTQKRHCKAWGNTARFPALLQVPHNRSKPLSLAAHPLPISELML